MFFKQGDVADCFYIVESGAVKIMIKRKVDDSVSEVQNKEKTAEHNTHYPQFLNMLKLSYYIKNVITMLQCDIIRKAASPWAFCLTRYKFQKCIP